MPAKTLTVQVEMTPDMQAEIEAHARATIAKLMLVEPESKIVCYGILVRHGGIIDRMLPSEQNKDYPAEDVAYWISWNDCEFMRFETEEAAQQFAGELQEKFRAQKYRFTVAVCRLEPRWFIANPDPKNNRELRPILSCEQL